MALLLRTGLTNQPERNTEAKLSTGLYHFRQADVRDTTDLVDLDVKSFDYAWSPSEWASKINDRKHIVIVASYYGTVIGFAVLRIAPTKTFVLDKLAVRKEHRRRGIGARFLKHATGEAAKRGSTHLVCIIPENQIYPTEVNITLPWLIKNKFKGTKPFIKAYFTSCGETEDGVKFTRTTAENE